MKERVLSFMLCIALLLTNVSSISNSFVAEAKEVEKDPVTVIACSDYQHPSGNAASATIVNSILSQIEAAGYDKADGFLAMGDYDYDSNNVETTGGIESLKGSVQSTYPNLADDKMVFVQGNHDVAGSKGLSPSGANDTDDYGVYVIHHDEFRGGGGDAATVQSVAAGLGEYLRDKADAGNKKPIFVISHLPLHYSTRTRNGGDAKYAQYLFEVMNKHAAEGQNIIYMYGHNHNSWGYDDYLGTGSVYLTRGDSIYIAKLESQTAVPTEYELAFTYMNAGYVGYNYSETEGADKTLTMTVFEIRDDLVTVERYSASGLHNMKSRGLWANNRLQVESKENYGADDSYLQKEYLSPQVIVGNIVENGNVRVITSDLTGMTVAERTTAKDEVVHSSYISYDVETTGYAKGQRAIVHVTLPAENEFDLSQPIFLTEKGTGTMTVCVASNGQIKFETNNFGDFELAQYKAISSVATEKTIYRLVSSFNKNGGKYLIVNKDIAGSAYALKQNNDTSLSSASVEIRNDAAVGTYIQTDDSAMKWEYIFALAYGSGAGSGYLKNQLTNRYLRAKEGSTLDTVEGSGQDYSYWRMSGGALYAFQNWEKSGDIARYWLKYNDGFSISSSKASVYIFEESVAMLEDRVSLNSTSGSVTTGANVSDSTGSKIIFCYEDGTIDVVDVTVSMLRDQEGNVVDTDVTGMQTGLQVYYQNTLIYDNYTLQVYHENGENYLDISEYRSGKVFTYPEKKGYVFAGWYEDSTFTKPLRKDVQTGYAYAKFANAEVLDAKYQIAADTTIESQETRLRLVTTVDSLLYKEVGFVLHANGKDSKPCVSDTVYNTIIGKVNGTTKTYYPQEEFDVSSKYFMILEVTGIPNSEFETDITVKPRWTTLDGTIVYGASKVVNIADSVFKPDYYNGITFERAKETVSLFSISSSFSEANISSYATNGISVAGHSLGEKGLKLIPSGTSYYPSLSLKYGVATVGTVISFMIYIDTDVTESKWWIESKQGSNAGDFVPIGVTNRTSRSEGYEVNQWIEVSYTLKEDVTDGQYIFFNMDNGGHALVDAPATIYMDNIKLTAPTSEG